MSEEKKPSWTDNHIAYIKGLKSATEQQQLLVILHEMTSRSPSDEKKYRAIERAEKAAERASKARQAASQYINSEAKAKAKADKKARDHLLITKGALIETAGLLERTAGELLGLLLVGKTQSQEKWQVWKMTGDAELAARAAAKKEKGGLICR